MIISNPIRNEPRREKTGRLFAYAMLISAFVFATRTVQSVYFLNPKFQGFSHLLWLYSLVCAWPGRGPEDRFSQNKAQMVCGSGKIRPKSTCSFTETKLDMSLAVRKPGLRGCRPGPT